MVKSKKQPLFEPDEIATHVSSEIRTALAALHEYKQLDPAAQHLSAELSEKFLKKYVMSTTDHESLELDAFILFEEVNKRMAWANSFPYPTEYRLKRGVPPLVRTLICAKALIAQVLGEFSEDEFFANCKNSSGTTLGIRYTDTSPEAKFKKLTYSPGVDKWFKYYLQYDFQLKRALPSYEACLTETRCSRATTVPKDNKKVRMICVEPMLNMFFQQGLMLCLTSRLEKVGLSFASQQDENRRRAWLASLTGREATIDWSSASDSLSYELVRYLLPRRWFYYLDQFRSKEIEYCGSTTKLHMFSTMGNACTFPLETLVFWSLCSSIQHDDGSLLKIIDKETSAVAVFGDDCIVKSEFAALVMQQFRSLGIHPNEDKSFTTGPFRESCGGDFLRGKDVRGFYLTGPSGIKKNHLNAWLNIIVNRLLNRFIQIEGPLRYIYAFHCVFDYLFSLYRKFSLPIYLVPTDFPDDAGVKFGADLFRFRRYFRLAGLLSEVTIDRHGTRRFSYLQSTYPEKRLVNQDIRYWMSIKGLQSEAPNFYSVKKRQRYVVAKGLSPVFNINADGRH